MSCSRVLFLIMCLFSFQFAYANYDESTDGDLSDDPANPTLIDISNGSNIVCASSTAGDLEYFTIVVPPGGTLDEIELTSITSLGVGFLAFQEGTVFTPSNNPGDFLGWTHLGQFSGGQLAGMNASGGIGFSIPLTEGSYTFWSQETDVASSTEYCLDFQITLPPPVVTAIPTMGEWGLIVLGLLMLIFGVSQIRMMQGQASLGKS